MRLRLLLNFKLLVLQFQYIGVTNFKLLWQRQHYIPSEDVVISNIFSMSNINVRSFFSLIKTLKLLKLVAVDKVDWIFGDMLNNYGCAKLLHLESTPYVGKQVMYKGFDTRIIAFKKKERFFQPRQSFDWVYGGVISNMKRYLYFFNATGGVKYKAKLWNSCYIGVDFFCGQWAQLYQREYVKNNFLIQFSSISVDAALHRNYTDNAVKSATIPEYANYMLTIDPRSNFQHIFNNQLILFFKLMLFNEFKDTIDEDYLEFFPLISRVYLYFRRNLLFTKNNYKFYTSNFFMYRQIYFHTDLRTMYQKALVKQNVGFIFSFFMLQLDENFYKFRKFNVQWSVSNIFFLESLTQKCGILSGTPNTFVLLHKNQTNITAVYSLLLYKFFNQRQYFSQVYVNNVFFVLYKFLIYLQFLY